jgi:polygalacturonase
VPTNRPALRFPADAGVINVKTEFGAKGDGLSDDTAAIHRARIIYFPIGI